MNCFKDCRPSARSLQRQLNSADTQQQATLASLQHSSNRLQAELMAQLRESERQVAAMREAESRLLAELDSVRTQLRKAMAAGDEMAALRREASEQRVSVASLKGTQHRLVQQVEALSLQLETCNKEKYELSRELEEV